MSIASEISRLQTAKADIRTAVQSKGVAIPPYTFGEFQWLASDGWYKYCDNQICTGDIITVKLTDYSTYRVSLHIRSELNLGGSTGRLWDSGWKTADYSITVSSTYNLRYTDIIISKRSGASITKEEAESALLEYSVTTPTLSTYNNYINNIPDQNTSIQKVVVSQYNETLWTNENLTSSDYHGYGSNSIRGCVCLPLDGIYDFSVSVTVNSNSILKYCICTYDTFPTEGVNASGAKYDSGWKGVSASSSLIYTGLNFRQKYVYLLATYISNGNGTPTLEEFKANATFEIRGKYENGWQRTQENVGQITQIDTDKFNGNTQLKEVLIPDTVTTLKSGAFYRCRNLRSINLENITYLEGSVFNGCYSLTGDLCMPKLTDVAYNRVNGAFTLTNITSVSDLGSIVCTNYPANDTNEGQGMFGSCFNLETVKLPPTLVTLNRAAFQKCTKLKEINLENVTYYGNHVFAGCISLAKNIVFPSTLRDDCDWRYTFGGSGITGIDLSATSITVFGASNIDSGTCMSCTSLTTVILNSSLTKLFNGVFRHCTSLSSVNFPESLTFIGGSCFENCPIDIANLYLPNLTDLGGTSFYAVRVIKVSSLGSITKLWGGTFRNCKQLTEITLPSTLTEIAGEAIRFCDNLEKLIFENSTPPTVGNGDFVSGSMKNTIFVPSGSLSSYATTTNLITYSPRMRETGKTYSWGTTTPGMRIHNNNTTPADTSRSITDYIPVTGGHVIRISSNGDTSWHLAAVCDSSYGYLQSLTMYGDNGKSVQFTLNANASYLRMDFLTANPIDSLGIYDETNGQLIYPYEVI